MSEPFDWLHRYQRLWRGALLALLVGALLGPWAYDRIHVPAQYPCSAPNIRLEGDFCGMPLSGMWIFFGLMDGLYTFMARLAMGTITSLNIRELLFVGLSMFMFVTPLSSLLLVIVGGRHRRVQVFHAAVCGLAAGVGLLYGLLLVLNGSASAPWMVWGLWLYTGLAGGALMLEVLAFLKRSRPL